MRAPLRRPLGIAVLLTLLMSIAMVSPAVVLGRAPTSTTVRGVNVDATTIPELQELMDDHKLTSVQLTQFYLHRIKKLNPALHAVITTSPTALADARAADKARRKGDDRPLLGIPIIVKDNINTTGMPTTAGSWALAGSSPVGRVHRPAAEGRGCDRHRQGQPVRVGEFPIHSVVERLERHRRPDEPGLCARPQPLWLELGVRRRRVRGPRRGRSRDGDRWLDRVPLRREQHRRHQADPRPPQPRGDHPDLGRPGHGRPDGPKRDRCGRPPRRTDRRRSGRSGDRGPGRARRAPTTPRSSTRPRSMARRSGSCSRGPTIRRSAPRSTRSCRTRSPRSNHRVRPSSRSR